MRTINQFVNLFSPLPPHETSPAKRALPFARKNAARPCTLPLQTGLISAITDQRVLPPCAAAAIRAASAGQAPEYQQGRTDNLPDEIKDR
jgi:hypothetical protein